MPPGVPDPAHGRSSAVYQLRHVGNPLEASVRDANRAPFHSGISMVLGRRQWPTQFFRSQQRMAAECRIAM